MSNDRPELVPSDIAILTLGSGLISTVMFRVSGLQCPFRAIGLACPGCGCGRAVVSFFTRGPFEAVYSQPTALLLVLFICCIATLGRLKGINLRRNYVLRVTGIAFVLGMSNLAFQIMMF
jgi:hypothetical protein